jgi:hypothetical protein
VNGHGFLACESAGADVGPAQMSGLAVEAWIKRLDHVGHPGDLVRDRRQVAVGRWTGPPTGWAVAAMWTYVLGGHPMLLSWHVGRDWGLKFWGSGYRVGGPVNRSDRGNI